jgi:hypothetical protein
MRLTVEFSTGVTLILQQHKKVVRKCLMKHYEILK